MVTRSRLRHLIKEHINNEHKKNSPTHYQFSYWVLNSKYKSEKKYLKNTTLFILQTGEELNSTDGPWGRQTAKSLPSVPCVLLLLMNYISIKISRQGST